MYDNNQGRGRSNLYGYITGDRAGLSHAKIAKSNGVLTLNSKTIRDNDTKIRVKKRQRTTNDENKPHWGRVPQAA